MATKAPTSRTTTPRATGTRAKRTPAKSATASSKTPATPAVVAPIEAVKRTARSSVAKATNAASSARKSASTAVSKAKRTVANAAPSRATTKLVGVAVAGVAAGLAVNFGRKALVQAPSVLAGDWFEALKAEHKMALTIFDAMEKTTEAQKVKRSTLLMQLKHALGKHAFTEENVIYPALREAGEIDEADHLNHDHGYVKQYLFELDEMPKNAPEFLPKLAKFRADLERHIREEEDKIFPAIHSRLTENKNKALTFAANKEGLKLA